jgi:hypothetical protein
MKPFERWQYEEVELTFGTARVKNMPTLQNWLAADEAACCIAVVRCNKSGRVIQNIFYIKML